MAKAPNILFIMSDDHASHAMSCYGSRINRTPHLDRIADGGMRLDNCFCTNSICTPSRAAILAGTYNHVNGVTTLTTHMDNRLLTFPKLLQQAGYQTAIFGKWHLGMGPAHEPTGFDAWRVLPGQGLYHDPEMIDSEGTRVWKGYVTDLITDMSLDWLKQRDASRPFMLMCHHKAPHRSWEPDAKHARMYEDEDIPVPDTFDDDYAGRPAAEAATMRIDRDLADRDTKGPPPEGLTPAEVKHWKYQRYIKDYLRCVASIDDNVGRILDYLDEAGIADDTMIIYTSDQGFYLGDHGWYDKRFMYEQSLRMPFIIRYPRKVSPGSTSAAIVNNVDFAPMFLEYAGVDVPDSFQGRSFRGILEGDEPADWPTSFYYRYWMHRDGSHNVWSHYGVRTQRYKLMFYYNETCNQPGCQGGGEPVHWELFDLQTDEDELRNVYADPAYASVVVELKAELKRLQKQYGDEPSPREAEVA